MPKNKNDQIAAIFDLDGTLLDTLPSLIAAANETMRLMGLPGFGDETVVTFVGMGWRVFVDRMMDAAGIADPKTIKLAQEIYLETFTRMSSYHVTPFPGIYDLLVSLKEAGMKIAVVTNKSDKLTSGVMRDAFPQGYELFDILRGAKRFVPLKPDPTATFDVLKQLNASPEKSFFIGDSDIDILTGKACGMHTVGVRWGYRDASELAALNPDLLANTPEEVGHFILKTIRT